MRRPTNVLRARTGLLTVASLVAVAGTANAIDGPGVGNLSYTAEYADPLHLQPLTIIYSKCLQGDGAYRNMDKVFMHRGWMIGMPAKDSGQKGGGVEVWDMHDPRHPTTKYQLCNSTTTNVREMNAYVLWRDETTPNHVGTMCAPDPAFPNDKIPCEYFASPSDDGIMIWEATDASHPVKVVDLPLPNVTSGKDYDAGAIWWMAASYPYLYVSATTVGVHIVDISHPTAPVRVGGFKPDKRANNLEVVGNILTVGGADSVHAFQPFDITDPLAPVAKKLWDDDGGVPESYNWVLFGSPTDHSKLYAAGTAIQIINLGDLTNYTTPIVNKSLITSKIGYQSVQDGYIHSGYSAVYAKIDVRTPENPASVVVVAKGATTVKPIGDKTADEDYGNVIGNIVVLGNDHESVPGSAIYPAQAGPDVTPPTATYINPPPGAANVATGSRIGIIFSKAVDHRTINTTTVQVKDHAGGAALVGHYTSTFRIISFHPDSPLAPGTQYDIVINGVKDWAGNLMTVPVTTSFTTAGTGVTPPASCVFTFNGSTANLVTNTGAVATLAVSGCTPTSGLTYSFDFGDATAPTAYGSATSVTHTYTKEMHASLMVNVKNSVGQIQTWSLRETLINPPMTAAPTHSTPIFYDDNNTPTNYADDRIFVVNPDRNSVRSFLASSLDTSSPAEPVAGSFEATVGHNPRTLAIAPRGYAAANRPGTLWVVSQDDPFIRILNSADLSHVGIIPLPAGSRPFGIAFNPDTANPAAYVTLEGTGKIIKINPAVTLSTLGYPTGTAITATLDMGGANWRPHGIAVMKPNSGTSRILVTRFITAKGGPGEIKEIAASTFTITRTTQIQNDTDPDHDSESSGRGVANYVNSITIRPDGQHAVVPSKKDNVFRGKLTDGQGLNFENTVRTIVSVLDLKNNPTTDVYTWRRDLNNADFANTAAYTSEGGYVFIATHSNDIAIYDGLDYNQATNMGIDLATGLTPQGIAIKPDNSRLYVWCFMSRTIETFDISTLLGGGTSGFTKKSSVSTQTSEPLAANILAGKKIFYNSSDPRMSRDSYIACSSCHLEGDSDGTVFDFGGALGEGLRKTIPLVGRAGMGHGRVHWSGNFDEIQDFENPIRGLFEGSGFMTDAQFNEGSRSSPLGLAKAGVSADLDNLAAYVASLTTVPVSPNRVSAFVASPVALIGQHTATGELGKTAFNATRAGLGEGKTRCSDCHSGRDFTDSSTNALHNVGTINALSGNRLGGALTGLDTPTLLGIWNTPPYTHQATAATLDDVFTNTAHVGTLSAADKTNLKAYLLELDGMSRDFDYTNVVTFGTAAGACGTAINSTISCTGMWSFKGNLQPGDYAYPDRAYMWTSVPTQLRDSLWIRTAADSKYYVGGTGSAILQFTVDKSVDVYIGMDQRYWTLGPVPTWLAGDSWIAQDGTGGQPDMTNTNPKLHLVQTEFPTPNQFDMRIYKKTFPAGVVTLKATNNNSVPFYSVILKATPASAVPSAPVLSLLSAGDSQAAVTWTNPGNASSYTVTVTGPSFSLVAPNITNTNFVQENLVNGFAYTFTVQAVNSAGSSAPSNAVTATPSCTLLTAPTNLSAIAGQAMATLRWDAVANATGYNLKRALASNPTTVVASPYTNVFTDTGLTPGTTYHYLVSATNRCGESPSSAVDVTVVPSAITSNNATLVAADVDANAGGVQLTYGDTIIKDRLTALGFGVTVVADTASSSSDADGQQLLVVSGSVNAAAVASHYDTVTAPVIDNAAGTLVEMRLANAEGTSLAAQTMVTISNAASSLAGHKSGDVQVTSTPAALSVGVPLASADKVATVLGDPSTAAVFAYDTNAALTSAVATARRVAFFFSDDASNVPGSSTAENANGDGWDLFGAAVGWATSSNGSVPAAPTSLTATGHSADITLTWTGSMGATSYKVFRSFYSGTGYSNLGTVVGTTFSDTTAAVNQPLYYVVTAVNAAGESGYSNETSGTAGCTLPAQPTALASINGDAKVTLTWSAVATANTYKVKRSTTTGSGYANVATGVTASGFVNTSGLTNGSTYYYVVSAVNLCGEGPSSAEVSAVPNPVPGAPGAPSATPSDALVTLSWTAGANASSYEVWRSTTSGAEAWLANAAGLAYLDTTAVNNTTYYYKVLARNSNPTPSALSGESAAAKPNAMPSTPTSLTATAGSLVVNLAWSAGAGGGVVANYELWRGTTSGAETLLTSVAATPTTYTDSAVTAGTTYFYKVKAKNNLFTSDFSNEPPGATPINNACARPTFANSTGATTSVTLATATSGASIRYTTNGTTPTSTTGTLYAAAFTVTPSMTVKAIAYKSGMSDSPIATALYNLPTADASVKDGSTGTNYGTATPLEVKLQTGSTNNRNLYLRFSLSAVTASASAAKVRLYGNAQTASKAYSLYAVSSITWIESGTGSITWANAPAIGTKQGSSTTISTTAQYWEWDVTAYMQAERALGHTDVSFAIKQDVSAADGQTNLNSKEATASKPTFFVVQ
jgi:fibronectin type 3 domain-containing protein